MASGNSPYLADELLDHVLGGPDFVRPATVYLALLTAGGEVVGNGYARLAVTNNATNFPAASGRAKTNGVELTFATPSGGGWGEVTRVKVFDAASSGNELKHGDLATAKTINEGDPVKFPAGELNFSDVDVA